MAWFKVDDKLHAHPKVAAAGLRPMGLWVVAGAWSSAYLTNGYVPPSVVHALAIDRSTAQTLPRDAARLVEVGLWEPAPDGGWWFHQWEQSNPTREDVLRRREIERERKAEWRASRNGRDVP